MTPPPLPRSDGGDSVAEQQQDDNTNTNTNTNSGAGSATLPADFAHRILDLSPISTTVIDSTGAIVFANERAAETLERSKETLTDRTYTHDEWNIYYDDGTPIPVEKNPISRVFETGEPEFGFEHWIELPDGSRRWLSTNSSPVFDEDGTVEYVIVSFEDVTELKRREELLTSEHVRLLEFRANRSAVPPSLRVDDGETRIEIDSVVSLPDGTTVQYMGTADLSASGFVTAIEEVPHFLDARLLSSIDGYSRIEAHSDSETVAQVFSSLGGRPREIRAASDEVRFLGELPGDVDARVATEGIRRFHPSAELVSEELVYSPHLLYDVVADALTERQLGVLNAAYFGGYFDTPRASTGDDLAARFDVTRQTFNQHLRKAQQTVFRHLFEKSGADAH